MDAAAAVEAELMDLEQEVKDMILRGCSPALIRARLRLSREQIAAVRREIERSGQGKKIARTAGDPDSRNYTQGARG